MPSVPTSLPTPDLKAYRPDAGIGLRGGRVYVVLHDEWTSMVQVGLSLLLAADHCAQKTWVTGGDPERELAQFPQARDAAAQGIFRVFTKEPLSAVAPANLLAELECLAAKRGSLVVIDGAESFFGPDADRFTVHRWAEQRECTMVLLCAATSAAVAVAIRDVADRLAGFARVRRSGESLWWDVYHWFGTHDFLAGRAFRLQPGGDGLLAFEPADAPSATLVPATDEDLVIAVVAALGGEMPPDGWQLVEDLAALKEASAGAEAATLVLCFNRDLPLDTLARSIFDLRRARGRRLKIVVRESHLRLRHNQEQLLLRLGANLVVPAEIGLSRFHALLETVQGQTFAHALPAEFSAALTELVPAAAQGRLAPAAFVEAVDTMVHTARGLGIQNALVRFPLPVGLSAAAAVSFCNLTRPGDLCTADDESLYLFLFACRENDVDLTLDRLFVTSVNDLFADETRFLSSDTIQRAVAELATRASHLPAVVPEVAAASPIEAHERASEPAPRTPARAVRHPLALRRGAMAKAVAT